MTIPIGTASQRITAVVGLQWGDEGKGKVVDLLSGDYAAVVRYNGGANAGHSVVVDGVRHATHLMPSGVFHPGTLAVIGNGCVVDLDKLLEEKSTLERAGIDCSGLRLSDRAHLVMDYHKHEDALHEALMTEGEEPTEAIGTTKRGIGPAYADKATRTTALRVGDLRDPVALRAKLDRICSIKNRMFVALGGDSLSVDSVHLAERCAAWFEGVGGYLADTSDLLHTMIERGDSLLFEGANATLLDLDHGTFPYVTSSNSSTMGIAPGSGVPGRALTNIVGVCKAYCTRVGGGPFPTELTCDIGDRIREQGNEYGTTTGRPRRCGWLDAVALRYAVRLNGVDALSIMLLDVLRGFDELKICTAYRIDGSDTTLFTPDQTSLIRVEPVFETLPGFHEDISGVTAIEELPEGARRYLARIEALVETRIGLVSVGPDRAQTIVC